MTLKELKSYQILQQKDSQLAEQVCSVYDLVFETINGIAGYFDNYTMHDMNHGLRVAQYIENLAFGIDDKVESKANEFSALELALMILSAILHDIGMFVRRCDEDDIKANRIKYAKSLTFEGVLAVKHGDEKEAVKEIIRRTHAARINEFIDFDIKGKSISSILMVNNIYSYAKVVAEICQAHGEDYNYLKELPQNVTKGKYDYNPQYIAALLRIADCLDLDKQRTPMLWYASMDINGFSKSEWETHFAIHNDKKLKDYIDGKLQIYFDGNSSNAKIHRKYLRYIDQLKAELERADALLNTKEALPKYRFNISTKIDDRVKTKGFQWSDLRLNLDYSAITELLMGRNIYGDNKLGLRELMQNAIDACKIMEEVDPEYKPDSQASVRILYSRAKNYVKIRDFGIGMTMDVVKNHFLNIGKSYYKSDEYLFNAYNYKPIGQYGIGFLACFLLSDNVTVKTKHFTSNVVYQVELEKNSEYVVTNTVNQSAFYGTEITLDYNKFFEIFETVDDLKVFLESYFYTDIPIYLVDEDTNTKIKIKNMCEENITHFLSVKGKEITNTIECSDYSNLLKGKVFYISNSKKTHNQIITQCNQNLLLFNESSNKLIRVSNIPNGYYSLFRFAMITEEEYKKINHSYRDRTKLLNEVFALAIRQNKEYSIFVKRENLSSFLNCLYDNDLNKFSTIFKNSGIIFWGKNMIDEVERCVFVYENRYMVLHHCYIRVSPRFVYSDLLDERTAFFYHKDILVRDFRYLVAMIPLLQGELYGYINYMGDDIKLSVSRNDIIEGRIAVQQEFSRVLLSHAIRNAESEEVKLFLQQIYDCNQEIE